MVKKSILLQTRDLRNSVTDVKKNSGINSTSENNDRGNFYKLKLSTSLKILQLKKVTVSKLDGLSVAAIYKYEAMQRNGTDFYNVSNAKIIETLSLAKVQLNNAGGKLVEFKRGLSDQYEALEINSDLLNFIRKMDLRNVIVALDRIKTDDAKTKLGISMIKQILVRFEKHNALKKGNEPNDSDVQLNRDLFNLTGSINLKNALIVAEPFVHLVPYGATALYIVSLFVRDK